MKMNRLSYRSFLILVSAVLALAALVGTGAVNYLSMIKWFMGHSQKVQESLGLGVAAYTRAFAGDGYFDLDETGGKKTPVLVRPDGSREGMDAYAAGLGDFYADGGTVIILKDGRVVWPSGPAVKMSGKGEVSIDGRSYLGAVAAAGPNEVFVGYPKSTMYPGPVAVFLGSLFTVLVILAAMFALVWMASASLRRMLGETTGAMWALADGDLSCRLAERGFVEERTFRRHFNSAVGKIQALMSGVDNLADNVGTLIGQSSSAAEQTGRSIQEQQDRVEAGSAALEEVSASVNEVSVSVQSATDLSTEARNLASEGSSSVDDIAGKANSARESMEKLVAEVGRLEKVSEEITSALTLINDISEETNLLSLNAAIEASRAGEAGRGFTVVADEIRNLAERSLKSARDVKVVVEGVMSSLRGVVSGIQEGSEVVQDLTGDIQGLRMTFHLISNSVEQVADKMLAVSTASEEQSQVISELSRQMSEITHSGGEIASAAQELSRTTDEIRGRMDELKAMLGDFIGIKK